WFAESIARRVGNGADTFFWTDTWLGGVPLRGTYGRLYELATNKLISVTGMCELGWGGVVVAQSVVGVGRGDASRVYGSPL
ncbi:cysteine-rich receptor-like protein kinase, partial [Trifolium medium]|nr:cysteine-rich receptor-like protein kinase [Trifolium medium]